MLPWYWVGIAHLHQAWVLIGRKAIDVMPAFLAAHLQEAGEAVLHMVRPRNPLFPVTHIDLQHLDEVRNAMRTTEKRNPLLWL